MLTSATGSSSPPRGVSGFTLLEVMIVIAIIALLSGLTAYSIQGGQSERILKTEAGKLQSLLQATADDAAIYDETLGIDFTDDGYRLMHYDDEDGWQPVKENKQVREYQVPAPIVLSVERDIGQSKSVVSVFKKTQPAAVFFSSGDVSSFLVTLQFKGADLPRYAISVNEDHVITVEAQHE